MASLLQCAASALSFRSFNTRIRPISMLIRDRPLQETGPLCRRNMCRTMASSANVLPTIDYSMLISDDHRKRSKAIEIFQHMARDGYGSFLVENHTVPERVISRVLNSCFEFFDLNDKDKIEFEMKDSTDVVRWGKAARPGDKRSQFLKFYTSASYDYPIKPASVREALQDYSRRTREVTLGLARGISMAMGLEESYIEKKMKLESGLDICSANLYPPCPSQAAEANPEGFPPHTDPSVLIILLQNVDGGLQMLHNDEWIIPQIKPNAFVVNIGDHLEILTNGKYKSGKHRVMMNNKVRRISLPIAFGPSLDTFVQPAPEFVDDTQPPAYKGQTYQDFLCEKQGFVVKK